MRITRWPLATALLLATAVGCSDSTDDGDDGTDDERPPEQLVILRLPPDAPPLVTNTVSFWATYGESDEARIRFQNETGGEGEEYLRFTVEDNSLLAYPDGTPFSPGDSVLITINVVDPQRILFEFQPAGLRFNPAEPAELEIRYGRTEGDYDDDGDSDEDDAQIETELAVWRQEAPGGTFTRLGTLLEIELDEVEVGVDGFSRFAIAY